jgi:hypothetical protein
MIIGVAPAVCSPPGAGTDRRRKLVCPRTCWFADDLDKVSNTAYYVYHKQTSWARRLQELDEAKDVLITPSMASEPAWVATFGSCSIRAASVGNAARVTGFNRCALYAR